MPDRALVQELVELGVEVTPGTGITPTRLLNGLSIDFASEIEFDEFGPSGQQLDTISAPRRESVSGSIEGYPIYPELPYLFSNIFGAATISLATPVAGATQWVWTVDGISWPAPVPWTVRRGVTGDTGNADEVNYGLVNAVSLDLSRASAQSIGGSFFGRRMNLAASMSGTSTALAQVPVLAGEIDVFMDSAAAGLGTTKLLRDFMVALSYGDRFSPIWPLNSAENSFAAHTFIKPTPTLTLTMGNDSVARGLYTQMRAGQARFIRVKATSGTMVTGATPHSLQIDVAGMINSAPGRGDSDGISTLEMPFKIVRDATWAKGMVITLITSLAAL